MLKIEFANAQHLKLMLSVAVNASYTDEERQGMYGVYLEVREGAIYALATDGHWAIRVRHDVETTETADAGFRFRVPLDDVKALLWLIGACEHPVSLTRDKTMAKLEINHRGHIEWHLELVEIVAPPIFESWPVDNGAIPLDRIGMTPALLTKMVKAFKIASGDDVPLKFAFHGEAMAISVTAETVEPLNVDAIIMPCSLEDEKEENTRQGVLFADKDATQAIERFAEEHGATVHVVIPGERAIKVTPKKKSKKPAATATE
jgi:hypothetical protein